jgi:hypothetical protein
MFLKGAYFQTLHDVMNVGTRKIWEIVKGIPHFL